MKRLINSENRNKSEWKSRLVENTSQGHPRDASSVSLKGQGQGICILASLVDSEHHDIGTACTQVVKWGKFVPAQKIVSYNFVYEYNGVAFLPQ